MQGCLTAVRVRRAGREGCVVSRRQCDCVPTTHHFHQTVALRPCYCRWKCGMHRNCQRMPLGVPAIVGV